MEHWSKRLTRAREDKGWTVVELAKRSGVGKDSIYKYERGDVEAPRGETPKKLAKALDVSVIWLVHGVEVSGVETSAAGLPSGQLARTKRLPIVELGMLTSIKPSGQLPAIFKEREVINVPDEVGPRAIVVRNDSARMAPKIPEGALVICDPDAPIRPGDCVFAVDLRTNEAVLGWFKATAPDNSKFELLAESEFFSTVPFNSKKDGYIVGRAMGLWQRL